MSDQRNQDNPSERLYTLFREENARLIRTTGEELDPLKVRARSVGCYHKRLPKGPDDPGRREDIGAFLDFLSCLETFGSAKEDSGPASHNIMLICRYIRFWLDQPDHGEGRTCVRKRLAKDTDEVTERIKVMLEGMLEEFEEDDKRLAVELME